MLVSCRPDALNPKCRQFARTCVTSLIDHYKYSNLVTGQVLAVDVDALEMLASVLGSVVLTLHGALSKTSSFDQSLLELLNTYPIARSVLMLFFFLSSY
jgi:hypothetical protein